MERSLQSECGPGRASWPLPRACACQ